MNLSLVGSQMSSEATSEQSSVRKEVGYNEVFVSSHESEEFSWLSEWETSAQSPDDDVKSYDEKNEELVVNEDKVEEGERESDGDDNDGDEESYEGTSGSPGGNRPFILPENWTVNKFLPKMNDRVFKELRTCYQIPDHIPICLPRKNERCYSGRTADIGMYDAMFAAGLRLPLTALHRQLVDFMGLSINQISLNA